MIYPTGPGALALRAMLRFQFVNKSAYIISYIRESATTIGIFRFMHEMILIDLKRSLVEFVF